MAHRGQGGEESGAETAGLVTLDTALSAALAEAEAHAAEKERASQREEVRRRLSEREAAGLGSDAGPEIRGMTVEQVAELRDGARPDPLATPPAPLPQGRSLTSQTGRLSGPPPVDLRERARLAARSGGPQSPARQAPAAPPGAAEADEDVAAERRLALSQARAELGREQERVKQLRADLSANRQRFQRLSERHDDLQARYQRLELELPRRVTSQVLTALLPALDAQEAVLSNLLAREDLHDDMRLGLQMVRQEWDRALQAVGVQPFDARGQRFDPVVHEAISEESGEESEQGKVLRQAGRGYLLEGRLLRSAQVVVATSPPKKS